MVLQSVKYGINLIESGFCAFSLLPHGCILFELHGQSLLFIHQLGDAFLIDAVCIVSGYRFEHFLKLSVDFGNSDLNVEGFVLGDFVCKPHADMNFQCFQHLNILLCRLHDGSHNSVLQQGFLNARRVVAVFLAVVKSVNASPYDFSLALGSPCASAVRRSAFAAYQ